MIALAALGFISVAWTFILFRRASNRELFDRFTLAALPPLGFLLLIETAAGVLRAPSLLWNEARMCRSLALIRGFSLYPPKNALGPVIGTLHTPVSQCFYILAAGFANPTALIVAGSVLSAFVVFAALGWLFVRAAALSVQPWLGLAVAFAFCGFLLLGTPGTYNTLLMIHTDAPALALATLACGILCGRHAPLTTVQVSIAGAACALVIGCKQTLAPLAVAVICFLALVAGWSLLIRFLAAFMATTLALLAAVAACVPMSAFFFNTVSLAGRRPLKSAWPVILTEAFRSGKLEALPAILPIAALLAYRLFSSEARPALKQIANENRWLIFVFAAISLIPVCAKAIITVGADVNHLGLVLYFLFVGAALAIQQNLYAPVAFLRLNTRMFAVVGILAGIAPGAALTISSSLRNLDRNAAQVAYEYSAHHHLLTYFPLDPAADLLARGQLYHFDVALFDREIGGAPLTPEQLRSGLPPHFERIALPPGEALASAALRRFVAGWIPIADPELPGWTVLRKP